MNVEHPREDRIQDFVDDLLCAEERAEIERHLSACDACRADVAQLRDLVTALHALPADVMPERDLRDGINAAIDASDAVAAGGMRDAAGGARFAALIGTRLAAISGAADGAATRRFRDRTLRELRMPLAAAAAALIAVTAAATLLLSRAETKSDAPLASAPVAERRAVLASTNAVEKRYGEAAAELEEMLARQRAQLAPETILLVEENLRIIDAALEEARAALREDPNNAALTDLLRSAYEKKLDLLRHATRGET